MTTRGHSTDKVQSWADRNKKKQPVRRVPTRNFTKEDSEYIKAHWDKCSAAVIAAVLGRTRNSVIGKAHRLGLADPRNNPTKPRRITVRSSSTNVGNVAVRIQGRLQHPSYTYKNNQGRGASATTRMGAPTMATPEVAAAKQEMGLKEIEQALAPAADRQYKSLLALEAGECRWPVEQDGSTLYCADVQVAGSSYCLEHSVSAGRGGSVRKHLTAANAPRNKWNRSTR